MSGRTEPLKLSRPKSLDLGLRFGRYKLTLDDLRARPHGVDLGELKECLPARLLTENKRINLAPTSLVKDLARLVNEESGPNEDFPFILIGRRHVRDNNSWLTIERLVKGKNPVTLMINAMDAELKLRNERCESVARVGAMNSV